MSLPEGGPNCPYVGLQPFREEDREYFFGRERDQRIIVANLLASPLTVLYGSSGVGKSSVLMAGVVPQLRHERPRTPVVVFREWVGEDFHLRLARACIEAVWSAPVSDPRPAETLPLDELLRACAEAAHQTAIVLFDQFEEYFLYHSKSTDPNSFEAQLARAINRDDVDVGFILSMREDGLAKLDRFQERIPHLLSNRLRLRHLDTAGAAQAIRRPLEVWNREHVAGEPPVEIEDGLVDALLEQIRMGRVSVSGRVGSSASDSEPDQIEVPFLQLVMTRLWQEIGPASRVLRLANFEALRGAQAIVRSHLDEVMNRLDETAQAVCASFFDRLVTPSGSKVACSRDDLARWAGPLAGQVPQVLQALSAKRILRTTAAAPERPEATFYEIYHDVLAPAVLDWRGRYMEKKDREEARRHYREETRRKAQQRLVWVAFVLTLVAVSGWVYSFYQQIRAEANAVAARVPILAPTDATMALDMALAAAKKTRRYFLPPTPATEDALRQAIRVAGEDPTTVEIGDWVWHVAFSPDGKQLAVGSRNNTATVWDLGSTPPKEVLALPQGDQVREVAFLVGGQRLLTISGTKAQVWELATRTLVDERDQGSTIYHAAALSPHGKYLATGGRGKNGQDRVVKVWNLSQARSPAAAEIDVQGAWVMGLAFSPDECCLATVYVERGQKGRSFAEIWSITSGKRLLSLPDPVPGDAVTFTPDGTALVVAGRDNRLRVFQPARGNLNEILTETVAWDDEDVDVPWAVDVLAGHTDRIRDIAVSRDGTRIASASGDHTIRIWDGATGESLLTLAGHKLYVESVGFSPDGNFLASGSRDRTVKIWDISRHLAPLDGIAFSPDNRTVATASVDTTAKVWDVSGDIPRLRYTLRGHRGEVYRVSFDPSGKRLATASFDGTARLWDVSTGQLLREYTGHKDQLRDVAFSPDGRYLATAGADGYAFLYDLEAPETDTSAVTVPADGKKRFEQLSALAFHPRKAEWLTVTNKGLLQRWDFQGRALGEVSLPNARLIALAISPDGTQVAALSAKELYLLTYADLAQPHVAPEKVLSASDKTYWNTVSYSPDGEEIAIACGDNAVRLFSAHNGILLKTITAHSGAATQAAFSPDGKRLATASSDCSFSVTPLDFEALYALARRLRQANAEEQAHDTE
jgi:WD40 repeat protein